MERTILGKELKIASFLRSLRRVLAIQPATKIAPRNPHEAKNSTFYEYIRIKLQKLKQLPLFWVWIAIVKVKKRIVGGPLFPQTKSPLAGFGGATLCYRTPWRF